MSTVGTRIELPDASAIEDCYKALSDAEATVEAFAWRVEKVADCHGREPELAPITLEGIGVVASVLADLDNRIDDFTKFREQIASRMFTLGAIREEQAKAAARDV